MASSADPLRLAVLVSGGPDSAVLVGELARTSPRVVCIYVRFGMFWEDDEERALRRYLDLLAAPADPAALRRAREIIDILWHEHDLVEEEHYEEACQRLRAGLQLAPDNAYLKHRLATIEARFLSPQAQ